jgi:predicted AAA+ superfamily ATPase
MREARKAVKKAIKLSKKRKIVTLDEIEKVRHIFQNLRDEIDTTHKALKVTSVNMRNALTLIQQETIDRPMDLMETARRQFRTKDFAKAMRTLEESRSEIRRRALEKTRAALFGGFSSQIECLRKEL